MIRWLPLLFMLELVICRGALAQDNSTAEVTPAIAQFDAIYAEWKKIAARLQQLDNFYKASNEQQRVKIRAEYSKTLDESNAGMARLILALEEAYKSKPKDRRISDLIAALAPVTFDGDRYEYTLALTKCLLPDFSDQPTVFDLAGRAAAELGQFDDAQHLLERALELKGLSSDGQRTLETMSARRAQWQAEDVRVAAEARRDDLPRVKLETTRGDIVLELFEDDVPNTVASFLLLVADGFYDGLDFFRVTPGFGALAGAPRNDGLGGPGYETLLERGPNGDRPHRCGYVSMVPLTDKTNGSQFFLTLRPSGAERLEGKQTVFGRIVEGMSTLERLHRVDVRHSKSVLETDRIIKASIVRQREHKYVAVSTADLAQRRLAEGLKVFQQKKWTEAEKIFRDGLDLFPSHHSLHFNLAAVLINQGRVDEGKKELQEALRSNPKHAKAHYYLAAILLQQKQKQEAVDHLKAARRIDPSFQPAIDLLRKAESS